LLNANEVEKAVAAGDRAGGTFWPIMSRYYLSYGAPASIAETLAVDALRHADRLGLAYFGALQRIVLAIVSQFRDESPVVLATWRDAFSMLDDDPNYPHDDVVFYALAEGEHGEVGVGVHVAEDLASRLGRRPHDPIITTGVNAVLAHLRRLNGNLPGAAAALAAVDESGQLTMDFVGGLAVVTRSALYRERGEPDSASALIGEGLKYVEFPRTTDIPMRVLEEIAAVSVALGRREHAADLLTTAREWRATYRRPLSPACQPHITAVSAMLDDLRGNSLAPSQVRSLLNSF
jgi:hypothetical protein